MVKTKKCALEDFIKILKKDFQLISEHVVRNQY